MYGIVRHPRTQTPLTIGIYGDWGSGKTSPLSGLTGLIEVRSPTAVSADSVQFLRKKLPRLKIEIDGGPEGP